MNEAEWASASVAELMAFLRGRIDARKARQIACACVRQALIQRSGSATDAIRLAESFADGQATEHQLAAARYGGRFVSGHPAWAVCWSPAEDHFQMLERAMAWASSFTGWMARLPDGADLLRALVANPYRPRPSDPNWPDLIRDVAGNVFRTRYADPAWLAWNGGTVAQVARAIYDERSFDQLPILGDALEEAGCDDAVMLDHCRGGGVHAVGCWLLDALLGLN